MNESVCVCVCVRAGRVTDYSVPGARGQRVNERVELLPGHAGSPPAGTVPVLSALL